MRDSFFEPLESRTLLAGTTLITHGYESDPGLPAWVNALSDAMMDSTSSNRAELTALLMDLNNSGQTVDSIGLRGGTTLRNSLTSTSETFVTLDWSDAANNFGPGGVEESLITGQGIASTVISSAFDADGPPILEVPIHLVGHGRGASAVSELARLLGQLGIWVDQVTYLDPRPLVVGDPGVDPDEVDPPVTAWSNIRFVDNYFSISPGDIDGQSVAGAANFDLSPLLLSNSEVRAFYYGTVDQDAGDDGAGTPIDSNWYSSGSGTPRNAIGYSFARLRNESRTTALALPGLHTELGGTGARISVPAPLGVAQWPNVGDLRMVGGSDFTVGEVARTSFNFADRDSEATITFLLDNDLNPYNGSIREVAAADMNQSDFASGEVSWSTAGLTPGTYTLIAKVTDGTRTRYDQFGGVINIAAPAAQTESRLFFPEGYNGGNVNEYVPLVNPNNFSVTYTILARYETGERDEVLATGTLAPNSRDGITITEANNRENALTRPDVPYAIEVVSSAPIGASLSHYDFDVATGEAFVSETSESWHFPSVNRLNGGRDFVVWYNPTDTDTVVTIRTVLNDGTFFEYQFALGALRRGGIDIQGETGLPIGEFSMTIEAPVPIVAALSHYQDGGFGSIELGAPTALTTTTVLPVGAADENQTLRVSLFNPGQASSEVTMVMRYDDGTTDTAAPIVLEPGRRATIAGTELGFEANRPGSLLVTSTHGIVSSQRIRNTDRGDSLGTPSFAASATGWLFADAFISPQAAGTDYAETLTIYNPAGTQQTISLTYLFLSGAEATFTYDVPSQRTFTLELHEDQFLLNRLATSGFNFFGLRVTAALPISTSMVHWDQNLLGGWQSNGTPIGSTRLL